MIRMPGPTGGWLCGSFSLYTLSLSGVLFRRRILFHQIHITLERHPTLIRGEKFTLGLAGVLGEKRVLVGCDDFNTVGLR
jgi:hypothetical protein